MDRIVNLSGCQTVSGIDHLFSGCLQCIIKSAVRFHSGSQEYVISRDQPTASSDFRRDTFFFHSKNSGRSIHRNMILADHILIYDMVAVTAASHNLRKHFHDSHVIGRLQRKLHRRLPWDGSHPLSGHLPPASHFPDPHQVQEAPPA